MTTPHRRDQTVSTLAETCILLQHNITFKTEPEVGTHTERLTLIWHKKKCYVGVFVGMSLSLKKTHSYLMKSNKIWMWEKVRAPHPRKQELGRGNPKKKKKKRGLHLYLTWQLSQEKWWWCSGNWGLPLFAAKAGSAGPFFRCFAQ